MGVRIGQFAAALGLLVCAGCGVGTTKFTGPTASAYPSATVHTQDVPASEPPYAEPEEQLRAVATRFVTAALSYRAWTEEQDDFLGRIEDVATESELRRLRHSGRANLRWWVLRQRAELATVHVTGVSERPASDGRVHLDVEAVRVTRSTASTVREFVAVTLLLVRTPDGWRVDSAAGGGL